MKKSILVYIALPLLFLSCFSYVTERAEDSYSAALDKTRLFTRVVPICAVALLSLLSLPANGLSLQASELIRPPFAPWLWYITVATASGFMSGIQPLWSAWKCFEVFVVLLWASALFARVRDADGRQMLKRCFVTMIVAAYVMVAWVLLSFAVKVGASGTLSALHLSMSYGLRLSGEWPLVNPITLAVLSMYALIGINFLTFRKGGITILLGLVASILPLYAFALSGSRTGLLVVAILLGYLLLSRHISGGAKYGLIMIVVVFGVLLAQSDRVRNVLRVDSLEDLSAGGGRISSEIRDRSAWGETIGFILESPIIGLGYINSKRFLEEKELSVDNGALQALQSAGVVGAAPLIIYVMLLIYQWIALLRNNISSDLESRLLLKLALLAFAVALAKGFTTNELSNHGFALILLFLSVATLGRLSRKAAIHDKRSFSGASVSRSPSAPLPHKAWAVREAAHRDS